MYKRIAIQGFSGSFHEEAAQHYFGKEVQVLPCSTFKEAFALASTTKNCDGALLAIENSLAGSILPNYGLLQKSRLHITGEIYLKIGQQLMVNKGVSLADIREVHSHPMALLQCMDYLDLQKWKLVETEDTALSARYIQQHRCRHVAAIAGKLAARLYGLTIIAPNIHSLKNNITRFLVLEKKSRKDVPVNGNKASVYFKTDHTQGSLARVLNHVAEAGINLGKLQSFPIPGSDWNYFFHADMEFNSTNDFLQVLDELKKCTRDLRLYGIYEKGKTI
jgi:prephenate dehydratase